MVQTRTYLPSNKALKESESKSWVYHLTRMVVVVDNVAAKNEEGSDEVIFKLKAVKLRLEW